MPRPFRCRRIERLPVYRSFSPDDVEASESVRMTVDEFEALRLLDDEGLTQEACAARMRVARTTVTSIYDSARKKVADALVNGKRLLITGGHCEYEPMEIGQEIIEKGTNTMRIAVAYENGEIFQHFGHTEQFKLYDVEERKLVNEQLVATNGSGHGALAGFLQALKTDALICGGIGMGARTALSDAGIRLYAGVRGSADAAARALAEGTLQYDPDAGCGHHGEGHECGHHGEGHECGHHGEGHECGHHGEDRECGHHGEDHECGHHHGDEGCRRHHGEEHECGHRRGEGLDCGHQEGDEGCRRHHGG